MNATRSVVWFKRDLRVHDHAPLGAALAIGANDLDLDAIFVKDGAHFVLSEIDVRCATVTLHKTVAVTVS